MRKSMINDIIEKPKLKVRLLSYMLKCKETCVNGANTRHKHNKACIEHTF